MVLSNLFPIAMVNTKRYLNARGFFNANHILVSHKDNIEYIDKGVAMINKLGARFHCGHTNFHFNGQNRSGLLVCKTETYRKI